MREAVDYCRYYAAQARTRLAPQPMPGPTGESNVLRYRGRGVFVCISPWNFPLAIFLGQVTAALAAGNAVVAKPAEQTPLVAARAVALLHRGRRAGDRAASRARRRRGRRAVSSPIRASRGVVFTGSTEVGRAINRALAAKDGPIVPLIAETGGINAMIVDATALPEQVIDDVDRRPPSARPASAARRCGCFACRTTSPTPMLDMLDRRGARTESRRSARDRDPCRPGDRRRGQSKNSKAGSPRWQRAGRVRFRCGRRRQRCRPAGPMSRRRSSSSTAPRELKEEVFGPVLHVVRWRADELDALLDDIAANGTALTLGIHSRIDLTIERIAARLPHGNIYVNRNMIGAVVGTQPFGGTHLSGTGPKAGGPNYLRRFAAEQVVTVNTAAAGGNAGLLAQDE